MGSVVTNLHEDTMAENTLHTIATSDPNPVDGVSCAIDEANSVPPNNGKFVCRETTTGSGGELLAGLCPVCSLAPCALKIAEGAKNPNRWPMGAC